MCVDASKHLSGRSLAAEPRFALGDWADCASEDGIMVAEVRRVAFTHRQWEAYQFILEFHQQHDRAPTAEELGRGLGINQIDSSKLMGALTAKGVLMRRIYHELAVVPPSFHSREFAEV